MKAPKRYALDVSDPTRDFYTVEREDEGGWRWYWTGDPEDGADVDMGSCSWPTQPDALRDAAEDAASNISSFDGANSLARRLRVAATLIERGAK